MYYTEKAIYSYSEIEIFKYKQRISYNEKRQIRQKRQIQIQKTEEQKQIYMYASQNRAKTKLRRLISCNLDLTKFYTLTFSYTMTDLSQANYLFNQFLKRLRYKFPHIKYIAVPEYQSDVDYFGKPKPQGGSIHYHLLIDMPYIKAHHIEKLWHNGFIKIKHIYDQKYLAYYFMKYFSKENADKRFFKKKRFFTSRNILQPIIIYGQNINIYLSLLGKRLQFFYKRIFQSDIIGEVLLKHFLINPLTCLS